MRGYPTVADCPGYDAWRTDPGYGEITAEQEAQLEARECQYCDGSGFFYSDPDLGPCNCVLDAGVAAEEVCSDCPASGYPTDKTRCAECPRMGEIDGR